MSKTLLKPNNLRLVAAVASLLLVSALIVRTTQAAFTDTTTNAGNDFASGSVSLSNDLTVPMFDVGASGDSVEAGNLAPDDTVTNCIEVTYSGTIDPASDITITTANVSTTGIEDDLDVVVTMGDAGVGCLDGSLDGTGAEVNTGGETVGAFGTVTTWTPNPEGAGDDMTRAFQFDVTLNSSATEQDGTADADFVWTASS